MTIEQQAITYCGSCSLKILEKWKGWPHKNAIPLLSKVVSGVCETCGSGNELKSAKITWLNYHARFNTGLPNYWLLATDGRHEKWGHPYYAEGVCPKCKGCTIVSEMKFPDGSYELKNNCNKCGVRTLSSMR